MCFVSSRIYQAVPLFVHFFSMYVFFVGMGGGELYICKYTVNTKKANWGEIGV